MYWLQRRRKETGRGQQVITPGPDQPRWLEARVEGEVPKYENLVLEMGGGIRILWVTARKPHWRASLSGRWDRAGDVEFSGSLRVFVAVEACDMRKGFEGLSALVGWF